MTTHEALEALCEKWERATGGSIPATEARYACARSIRAILQAEEPPWKCKARGNVGASDPQDCDWPTCGCDPQANKVIEALEEISLLKGTEEPRGDGLSRAWHELTDADRKEWNDGVMDNNGRRVFQTFTHAYRLIVGKEMPSPETTDDWNRQRLTSPARTEGLRELAQKVANRMHKMLEGGCECDADMCVCGYNAAMHEWADLNAALAAHPPQQEHKDA